ncbi:MAG: hypothetical protein AAFW70_12225 [Cyanobacteria bacterium J06635_10]
MIDRIIVQSGVHWLVQADSTNTIHLQIAQFLEEQSEQTILKSIELTLPIN